MQVGIERLALYSPRLQVDALQLAAARGRDAREIAEQVMIESRSVVPIFEDTVTLAVNAVRMLTAEVDLASIELLIVNTESAVDFGKPVSTWVHRHNGLQPNCRNFEVKHACYGAAAALRLAATWIAAGVRLGKKALVVSADYTRPHLHSGYDFVGGGCAVAMLVSSEPDVFELDLGRAGYWTNEIADIFRPTAKTELGDNQASLCSYLDALEGAYGHFEEVAGPVDFDVEFRKHIYHAPFPGMTFQAHRTLLNNLGILDREAVRASFRGKVAEGLGYARQLGSSYGASNFVCLLGLLATATDLGPGDPVSLFAYGSGCQGEFYCGRIGPRAAECINPPEIARHLEGRLALPLGLYEANERARESSIDCADFDPHLDELDDAYQEQYEGRGLLVLKRVRDYRREYDWS